MSDQEPEKGGEASADDPAATTPKGHGVAPEELDRIGGELSEEIRAMEEKEAAALVGMIRLYVEAILTHGTVEEQQALGDLLRKLEPFAGEPSDATRPSVAQAAINFYNATEDSLEKLKQGRLASAKKVALNTELSLDEKVLLIKLCFGFHDKPEVYSYVFLLRAVGKEEKQQYELIMRLIDAATAAGYSLSEIIDGEADNLSDANLNVLVEVCRDKIDDSKRGDKADGEAIKKLMGEKIPKSEKAKEVLYAVVRYFKP